MIALRVTMHKHFMLLLQNGKAASYRRCTAQRWDQKMTAECQRGRVRELFTE